MSEILEDFKIGQKLKFDVYGTSLEGKFVSITESVIEIKVIHDSTGVSQSGQNTRVHKSFLIK